MNIRAKVKCWSINKSGDNESVTFGAVIDNSSENKLFSIATPSLSLTINISNPSAQNQFVDGQEYYLDFSKAD